MLTLPYRRDEKYLFLVSVTLILVFSIVPRLSLSSEVADRQGIKIPEQQVAAPDQETVMSGPPKFGSFPLKKEKYAKAFFGAPTRVEKTPFLLREPIVKSERVPGRLGGRGEIDSKGGA